MPLTAWPLCGRDELPGGFGHLITEKEMQQAIAANCSTLELTLHAPPLL